MTTVVKRPPFVELTAWRYRDKLHLFSAVLFVGGKTLLASYVKHIDSSESHPLWTSLIRPYQSLLNFVARVLIEYRSVDVDELSLGFLSLLWFRVCLRVTTLINSIAYGVSRSETNIDWARSIATSTMKTTVEHVFQRHVPCSECRMTTLCQRIEPRPKQCHVNTSELLFDRCCACACSRSTSRLVREQFDGCRTTTMICRSVRVNNRRTTGCRMFSRFGVRSRWKRT
jgi:hypothetical protein